MMKKLFAIFAIVAGLFSCANKGYECACVDNDTEETTIYDINANSRDIAIIDCLGRNDGTRTCSLN